MLAIATNPRRKMLRNGLLAFVLAGFSIAASAQNWVEFATSANMTFYYDASTVARGGGIVKIWVKTQYGNPITMPSFPEPIAHAVDRWTYRCADRTGSTDAENSYAVDGTNLYHDFPHDPYTPITPSSVNEVLFKIACESK